MAELLVERQDAWEIKRDLAEALLRKALTLNPASVQGHVRLAKVLSWQGQHAAAVEACQVAIRLDPENAEPHYQLGSILALGHHPEEGRPYLIRAIELAGSSKIGTWARNTLSSIERHTAE